MVNFLAKHAAWLGGQLKRHAGRTVRIQTGYSDRIIPEIVGTLVLKEYEIATDATTRSRFMVHDWTFVIADLVDSQGRAVELQQGDFIDTGTAENNGIDAERWEILPPDDDHPAVEPLGSSGVLVLVHSKQTRKAGYGNL